MPSIGVNGASCKRAFTLVEVMFATMIVGTLSAMLFPVLSNSQDAARKSNCVSNLKQMAMATIVYAIDYDDRTFLGQGPGFELADGYQYWWGFVSHQGEVDYTRGVIGPYLKSGAVQDCPNAADMAPNRLQGTALAAGNVPAGHPAYGPTNAHPDFSQAEIPAETLLMADIGGLLLPDMKPKRWGFTPVLFVNYALHARHGCEMAVVSWMDGHAKAEKLSYRPFDSRDSTNGGLFGTMFVPAEIMRAANIGDLLKFPRATIGLPPSGVTPIGVNVSCDWYYYQSGKPKGCS